MERLRSLVDEAATLREKVQQAYFDRLNQRMKTMLDGGFDKDRILQEAALIAERSDVEEEVTRLRTHIDHFVGLLDQGGEVGKKLDFLLQEMNREANTLLSKTSGVAGNGTRITEAGLGMKSEIEKAREQVQNLSRTGSRRRRTKRLVGNSVHHFGAVRVGQIDPREPAPFAGQRAGVFRFLDHARPARL